MYEMTDQELEAAFDQADYDIKAAKEEAFGAELTDRADDDHEAEYDDAAAEAYELAMEVKHDEDLIIPELFAAFNARKSCACCGTAMDKPVTAAIARRAGLPEYAGTLDCLICRPFGPGAICCDN